MEAKVNLVAVGVFVIVHDADGIGSVLYLAAAGTTRRVTNLPDVHDRVGVGLNRNAPVR